MMWTYKQPTEIRFGTGARRDLPSLVHVLGQRPVLVSDRGLSRSPMTAEILDLLGSSAETFFEVEPNPTVDAVDNLAMLIQTKQRDVVVALGGGLPIRLSEAGVALSNLDDLVETSFHPLMNNNPRSVTPADLRVLYEAIL